VRGDIENSHIYQWPSKGNKENRIFLENNQSIRLYLKIADEPWWLVSRSNQTKPEGWISELDIKSVSSCNQIPKYSLSELPSQYFGSVVFADSFIETSNRWINNDSDLEYSKVSGYQILVIPAHKGENLNEKQNYGRHSSWSIPTGFSLATSYRVSFSNFNSFFGFRFRSIHDLNDYIEVRFYKERCLVSYHIFEDNFEIYPSIPVPFENEFCYSSTESMIVLSMDLTDTRNQYLFTGMYQNEPLPVFEFSDLENRFNELEFEFFTSEARLEIDYVLFTAK